MGILFVIVGGLAIGVGIFAKEFHVADIETLSAYKDKLPTWLGRLLFIVVGAFFVGLGIKSLIRPE